MRSLLCVLVVAAAVAPATASSHASRYCAHPSQAKIASLPSQYPLFNRALHRYFGVHWREAAVVSFGEGTWHWWASNGQYRGTFQMGAYERATFGDSSTLAGQARAASRYYWSDRSWRHWDCVAW